MCIFLLILNLGSSDGSCLPLLSGAILRKASNNNKMTPRITAMGLSSHSKDLLKETIMP